MRDLFPVDLFPTTTTTSNSTAAAGTGTNTNSNLTRSPSQGLDSYADAVKRGRERGDLPHPDEVKIKQGKPSPPSYHGEVDMTRSPSGFGNESFEITLGTISSRLKRRKGAASRAKRMSTLTSVMESPPPRLAKTPRVSWTAQIEGEAADDYEDEDDDGAFYSSSVSAVTSPMASVISSLSTPSTSSAFLDDDLGSMPNSPWSSIRKRVGVQVPRQHRLNLANYSSILALLIAMVWVLSAFVYSCW